MKTGSRIFQLKSVAISILLVISAPASVRAFEIKNQAGEVIGSFDTTISWGGSWRAQKRDPTLLAIVNGGSARSANEDDGNLNYDKHKLYSNQLKATHELELKHNNLGVFTRGTYFYDFAYRDQAVTPSRATARAATTGSGRTGSCWTSSCTAASIWAAAN